MQIALTSPFGYPEVARGAERYCRELGEWLAGRGHEVTWLHSAPPGGPDAHEDDPHGLAVERPVRSPARGSGRLQRDDLVQAGWALRSALAGRSFDLAQCHHHVDAAALRLTSGHPPYVVWVPGVARRNVVRRRLLHVASARIGLGGATRVHTLSRHAQVALRDEFGVDSDVVPPGVDVDRYAGPRREPGHPLIVCTAAADDPRKNVSVLVAAFERLLRTQPDAQLVVANHRPEAALALRDALSPAARTRMDVRAGLHFDELAALYRTASVSVLPSVDEAFGLVMVESLAAGTPVVGTDHGAIPEVVDDDAVGRRFAAGDVDALVAALLGALELAADPATAERCRAHARRWSWSTVGPLLEDIYGDVAA